MKILRATAIIVAAGLLTTACATVTHEDAKKDAASILAKGAQTGSENQAETAGRTSMANGDAWTATRLFRRAAEANDTPLNRFNLAAGYQNTGRLQDALVLYKVLVHDGRFIWVTPNNDLNAPAKRLARFNLGEEAGRRVNAIQTTLAGTKSERAADMADNIGGAASTEVGGPTRGAVSDERARQLDVKADAIRVP